MAKYFAGFSNQSSCEKCPIGKNTPIGQTGATTCQSCDAGRAGEGCKICQAGQYRASSNDESTCIECLAGFYQREKGQASCLPCAPGLYQNLASQPTCLPCIPQTFSNESSLQSCYSCPNGEIANVLGSMLCEKCPAGKYGRECTDCVPGHYRSSIDPPDVCKKCLESSDHVTIESNSNHLYYYLEDVLLFSVASNVAVTD